jgi:predicted pyridoxine 5'-phosphate oxidase superfamily flavin-nucleotide-binding protein
MRLTDEMKEMVERLRLCYVATVTPDGKPNLSPKGSLKVWDDETVVFAYIASPGTMRNLRSNPFIEINLVDPFLRRGFRFKGRAEVCESGPEFDLTLAPVSLRTRLLSVVQNPCLKLPQRRQQLDGLWNRRHSRRRLQSD